MAGIVGSSQAPPRRLMTIFRRRKTLRIDSHHRIKTLIEYLAKQ
jgi:hypothetical protein